jgi:hypothetical protein
MRLKSKEKALEGRVDGHVAKKELYCGIFDMPCTRPLK